ncbi:MAG: type II toxin-antitoxin system YafQ family toxin [Planctomycetaceae bacterium]|nr:type II toxin-antitoxin system YafQ family toxin [Planctomycetaceae bacterium]
MKQKNTTTKFRKDLKRIIRRGYDTSLMNDVVAVLQQGELLEEKHHDHSLSGTYEGNRECHIKPDWLLIYKINNGEKTLTVSHRNAQRPL